MTIACSSPRFSTYLDDIGGIPLLSPERERELGAIIQAGGSGAEDAVEELMRHNLKLVVSVATPFAGKAVPLEDLASAGNDGLRTAAERFDPTRGTRFSTYATFWIKQAVMEAVRKDRQVTIPHRRVWQDLKITRAAFDGTKSFAAIAEEVNSQAGTNFSAEEVEKRISSRINLVSLQQTLTPDSEDTVADLLPAEPDHLQTVMQAEEFALLEEALSELKKHPFKNVDPERVVRGYFGLGCERRTLEQLGGEFGVSRERIRQVVAATLKKLKRMLDFTQAPPTRGQAGANPKAAFKSVLPQSPLVVPSIASSWGEIRHIRPGQIWRMKRPSSSIPKFKRDLRVTGWRMKKRFDFRPTETPNVFEIWLRDPIQMEPAAPQPPKEPVMETLQNATPAPRKTGRAKTPLRLAMEQLQPGQTTHFSEKDRAFFRNAFYAIRSKLGKNHVLTEASPGEFNIRLALDGEAPPRRKRVAVARARASVQSKVEAPAPMAKAPVASTEEQFLARAKVALGAFNKTLEDAVSFYLNHLLRDGV